MDMSNYTFFFLLGASIGVFIGVAYMQIFKDIQIRKYRKSIEDLFLNVLTNFDKLIFTKRINKYAYFTYENFELIYQLDNKALHIFNKEDCLATSKSINSKVISDLLIEIDGKWGNDINNIMIIDNNQVSVNFIEEQKKKINSTFSDPILNQIEKENNITHYSIDDILDKINKVGYNNLTKEEKDFLNNASK